MAEPSKTQSRNDPSDYYDILVVGRTGMGKSTTANKLLGIDKGVNEALFKLWGEVMDKVKRFRIGDAEAVHSTTTECKVISNEPMVRVFDTPGFADSRKTKDLGVLGGNLQLFRWILRNQEEQNLAFRRVLYFLPIRGALEYADGVLQEEIKVMYEFLGQDFFNIMVIIATNRIKHQKIGFDEEDKEKTQRVFTRAFEGITGQHLPKCPPILYLKYDEKDVTSKIKDAEVIAEIPLRYTLKEPVVIDVKPSTEVNDLIKKYPTKRLQFQDRCSRCAGKIIYEASPTGKRAARIIYENGDELPWEESKCHPLFVPKYSVIAEIKGGIVYIISFGKVKYSEKASVKDILPWRTNSEEVCPVSECKGPPGSIGCSQVGKEAEVPTQGGSVQPVMISHTTKLDKTQLKTFMVAD